MFKFEGELVMNGAGEGSALWFYLAQFSHCSKVSRDNIRQDKAALFI